MFGLIHKWWYDPRSKSYNPDGLKLTKEADKPIIGARTASGTAVHLAYIMGCDPIILLGCDCCYMHGKRYFWQFPNERTCKRITGERVFCHNNRGSHKGYAVDFSFYGFYRVPGTRLLKPILMPNIIDASPGPLDCFKKIDFEELLETYGKA